jgi:hypothetical protein
MKRRGKTLLLLTIALGAVIGGYYLIASLTKEPAKETAPPLFSVSADDLARITWTYQDSTITLVKGDSGWGLEGSAAFPLDASQVTTITGLFQSFTPTNTIATPSDLSEYGLEKPSIDITLELTDGTSQELKIGDCNSSISSYYLLWNGNVYTVSSDINSAFAKSLCDLATKESIPDFENITSIAVNNGVSKNVLKHSTDGLSTAYTGAFQWFAEDDSSELPLDPGKMETYVSGLKLTWQKCVAWNADDDALATYGLGLAAASVKVDYIVTDTVNTGSTDASGNPVTQTAATPKTFTLLLGADTDSGRYVRIDGSRMVYIIASDDAKALLSTAYDSLKPASMLYLNWDEVNAFDLVMDGQTLTLLKNEDAWVCRGAPLDSTLSDSLKSALTGLTLADAAGSAGKGSEITGKIYQSREGFAELDFTLSPASNGWTGTLGGTQYSVTADTVGTLRKAIQTVLDAYTASSTSSNSNSGTSSGSTTNG